MSKDLMNPQDFVAGLTRVTSDLAAVTGGIGTLLRLLKAGRWVYGADDTEVEEGSLWAVNPASIKQGYVAWLDGELVGEAMAPVTGAPIDRTTLADVGAPWKQQVAVDLQCMSGEDEGETVSYRVTSVGGLRACQGIITGIIKQIGQESTQIVPVVKLEVDSYKHKEYGRIYTPDMPIVKWLTMDGIAQDDAEEAEEEAPAPKRLAKKKPAAKKKVVEEVEEEDDAEDAEFEEVEEEAPKPRRRRRA